MFSVGWFFIGFMVCFCVGRYADMVAKDAGDACGGDCGKCTAHCAGYHCHLLRNKDQTSEDGE